MPPATREQAGAWRPPKAKPSKDDAAALFYTNMDLITGKVIPIPAGIDRHEGSPDESSAEDDGLGLYDALSMGDAGSETA